MTEENEQGTVTLKDGTKAREPSPTCLLCQAWEHSPWSCAFNAREQVAAESAHTMLVLGYVLRDFADATKGLCETHGKQVGDLRGNLILMLRAMERQEGQA